MSAACRVHGIRRGTICIVSGPWCDTCGRTTLVNIMEAAGREIRGYGDEG